MKKFLLAISFALTACATAPQSNQPVTLPAPEDNQPVIESPAPAEPSAPAPAVATKKPANCEAIVAAANKKWPECPRVGHKYRAWDMATYADRALVEYMVCQGFTSVLRYFDWDGQESLKGKIPTLAELALYDEYGLTVALVFQHNNRPYSTFADTAGQDRYNRDPAEILKLAARFKMPKGRTVYLGVDSDDHWKDPGMAAVLKYFTKIAPKLRVAGYKVGMYGPGNTCKKLLAAGLIDRASDGKPFCWMPGATGWSGVKDVLASGQYVLAQKTDNNCFGKNLDYNVINSADFGQWSPQ